MKRLVLPAFGLLVCAGAMAQASHSGSLPVMHIVTSTPMDQIDRETYVAGSYWLESNGAEGVADLGSETEPLTLQVRGRGNYTWVGFDKKPWRLLLDEPQDVLGLQNNDYFGLFAHADDDQGFLRNQMGFEVARLLKMEWTPTQRPVELYFNGDYRGLYFCTELVRVEPGRVNVYKQADNDDSDVTGGWMCEIDNYDTDPHIKFKEGNGESVTISHKTPYSLSAAQRQFLTNQMTTINSLIYSSDKENCGWADMVDLEELAKFYVTNEIMDDYESFHGSCFLHRDRGDDSKWKFGPVWDFGSSCQRGNAKFIWQGSKWSQIWIGEMYKFPAFQEEVRKVWADFCRDGYDKLPDLVGAWTAELAKAVENDAARWPSYGNPDILEDGEKVLAKIQNKCRWLGMQWGVAPDDIPYEAVSGAVYLRGQFNDWGTSTPMQRSDDGLYSVTVPDLKGSFKVADEDWSDINYGSNGKRLEFGVPYVMKSGSDSSNIEMKGGVKEATVTFDPVAETLLVEGEWYEIPDQPVTATIYFRGDLNDWGTDMPFELCDDGLYRLYVRDLTKRFKVADSSWGDINYGGDNVTECTLDVPYTLVKKGKNITMAQDVAYALLTVDLEELTVTVTDADSGVELVGPDAGRTRIFTLQGVEMTGRQSLPKGLYIVLSTGGKARKVMLGR